MHQLMLTVHITAASLALGTLFLQSLIVVMARRLPNENQQAGVRSLQERIHRFVYYPILAVALAAGLVVALQTDAFGTGKWLHWKLVAVVLLIGLGMLTGAQLRARHVGRQAALAVHILIVLVGLLIVFLVAARPF